MRPLVDGGEPERGEADALFGPPGPSGTGTQQPPGAAPPPMPPRHASKRELALDDMVSGQQDTPQPPTAARRHRPAGGWTIEEPDAHRIRTERTEHREQPVSRITGITAAQVAPLGYDRGDVLHGLGPLHGPIGAAKAS